MPPKAIAPRPTIDLAPRSWAARHQGLARILLVLVVVSSGALLLYFLAVVFEPADFGLKEWVPRDQGAGGEGGEGEPRYRRAAPAEGTGPKGTAEVRAPEFSWRDETRLRQAAALLAEQRDLNGALSLLLQGDPQAPETVAAGKLAYQAVLTRIEQAVPRELTELRACWRTLDAAAKTDHFASDAPAAITALETVLARELQPRDLGDLGAALPESLLYCLLSNLHAAGAADHGPPALVELAVESRIGGTRLAKRLYWQQAPTERTPYERSLEAFTGGLNQVVLLPLAMNLLGRAKQDLLLAGPGLRTWYTDYWGATFCTKLLEFSSLEPQLPEVQGLWQGLPAVPRTVLSQALYRQFLQKAGGPLAPAALRANPLLVASLLPVPGGPVLQAVRHHPEWRRPLRLFAHDLALQQLSEIIAALYLQEYAVSIKLHLTLPLKYEREQVLDVNFDWAALMRELKIGEGLPPSIKREAPPVPPGGRQTGTWLGTSENDLVAALNRLAARAPEWQQGRLKVLAKTCAVNRGLEADSQEDRPLSRQPAP